jgi:hypothetical protein
VIMRRILKETSSDMRGRSTSIYEKKDINC